MEGLTSLQLFFTIGNPLTDGTWTYTWEHGRQLGAMAETADVIITTQPEDCFTAVGERCSFTVAAAGTGLTYQWQYSSNDGATWTDSLNVTAVTPTMTITAAKASQIGLLWRCIVTDEAGRTAISQIGRAVDSTVTTPITITNQPDNLYCSVGDPVSFTVAATGTGLTYQWQYSSNGVTWKDSLNTTAVTQTFALSAVLESQIDLLYRCKITDESGNVVYSRNVSPKRETTLWEYTYNADGLRTSRTNGESTYNYVYNGSQLTHMTVDGHTLYFTYDASGTPMTVEYDGTTYYYTTNLQGDIIVILDANGNAVVEYTYDAWGNIYNISGSLSATLGRYNPLRYRGYVYDNETKLYYLQSRYYNPEMGRFINADNQLSTGNDLTGTNLFAYCGNNPVNRVDPTGEAWWHWAIGAAVVAACAVATVVTCGGFAAAAGAVAAVASGVAAATTASTIAAAAFIGSATVYTVAVVAAASNSNSVKDFCDQGNWGTVAATAGGAVFNGAAAYSATRTPTTTVYRSVSDAEAQDIKNTGKFNLARGGMESKQFGFNYAETKNFGNKMGQSIIVSAKVPTNLLGQFYDGGPGGIDTTWFPGGTLTVYGDKLSAFNQAVSGTIKFLP